MEEIVGKIGVEVSEGAAHVVFFISAGFHQFLEFWHDHIVTTTAMNIFAQAVVGLGASVKTEDHIIHFLITEFNDIIIDEDAIGGQGEAEALVAI
ncbi:hypothetical protein SDC9_76985 [bioreactor metagenome]|uniref:Uncharacterized protein n=1 Tax=bioreactor metagenome TaxID=1076179 RepID=A0A644YPB2_9ZZZZ